MKDKVYYNLAEVDRIRNPDQVLTNDIQKVAESVQKLLFIFSQSAVKMVLFSIKLPNLVGYSGVIITLLWHLIKNLLKLY